MTILISKIEDKKVKKHKSTINSKIRKNKNLLRSSKRFIKESSYTSINITNDDDKTYVIKKYSFPFSSALGQILNISRNILYSPFEIISWDQVK